MVLQIITYDTANPSVEEFSSVMSQMKEYYLGNGCVAYDIFRDSNDEKRFYEMAYFETMEDADAFDKIDSADKNELFKKFCSISEVISETVDVKILEKI